MVYSDTGSRKTTILLLVILTIVAAGAVFFFRSEINGFFTEALKGQVTAPSQLHTEELQTGLAEEFGVEANPLLLFALFYPEKNMALAAGDKEYSVSLAAVQGVLREDGQSASLEKVATIFAEVASNNPGVSADELVKKTLAEFKVELDDSAVKGTLIENAMLYEVPGYFLNLAKLRDLAADQGVQTDSRQLRTFLDTIYTPEKDLQTLSASVTEVPNQSTTSQEADSAERVPTDQKTASALSTTSDAPSFKGLEFHAAASSREQATSTRPLPEQINDIRALHAANPYKDRPRERAQTLKEALDAIIAQLFQ